VAKLAPKEVLRTCVVQMAPVLVRVFPDSVRETKEIDGSRRLSISREIIVVDILKGKRHISKDI